MCASDWPPVTASCCCSLLTPAITGLRVDPVLPAAWAGFTATRRFRGATYQISVRNPDRISGRVANLEVDGHLVKGTLVPLAPAGTTVHVEAVVR